MSFNRDSAKAAKAKQLSKKAEKKERNVAKFTKSQEKTISEYFIISSQSDKTQTARNAKAAKKLRAENNNLKRKIGKLEKKDKMICNERSRSTSPSPTNKRTKNLINEKVSNSKVPKSRRRYANETIMIAAILLSLSLPCYSMLRYFDIWPSRQAVELRLRSTYVASTEKLISLENIHSTVDNYRQENSAEGKIKAILAVDAISLTPEIYVTKNKLVKGLLQDEILRDKDMKALEVKFKEFEKFCRSKKDVTITDAFLYNVQPIRSLHRSFVAFFQPSSQGKATDREVQILNQIKEDILIDEIEIVGFAFDGDSTYRTLHNDFFQYYDVIIRDDPLFSNFSLIDKLSIISDPLHILKRARYRLFSGTIHSGFDMNSNKLNLNFLKNKLNLPTLVFSNKQFTKMQDCLPIELFSLESIYVMLNENNLDWISYFLPFVLLNSALSETVLTVEERRTFVEIAFYYSFYYVKESNVFHNPLPQRKSKYNIELQMYNEVMMIEFCNTAVSILKILDSFNESINLNRIGSNPVEHIFGLLRIKSRNKHTYEKMKKVIGKIELHKQLLKELGVNQPISGRRSYYGQTIFNIVNGTKDIFEFNPRQIAFSLHHLFGLPINCINIQINNKDYISKNAKIISEEFFMSLKTIFLRLHPKMRESKMNSHEIHISSGKSIHYRILDKEIVK